VFEDGKEMECSCIMFAMDFEKKDAGVGNCSNETSMSIVTFPAE